MAAPSDTQERQKADLRGGCLVLVIGFLALVTLSTFAFAVCEDDTPDPDRLRFYRQAYPRARAVVLQAPSAVCRVNVVDAAIDELDPFASTIEHAIWFNAFTDACILAGQLSLDYSEYFPYLRRDPD